MLSVTIAAGRLLFVAKRAAHLAVHVTGEAGQRHRRTVLLALIQALQHHLVELGIRAPAQERVELRSRASLIFSTSVAGLTLDR
jgi:hypothetical protein